MERLTIGTLTGETTKEDAAVLRALARAYAEGTHEKFTWFVNRVGSCAGSGSEHYLVLLGLCDCLAGRNDVMCKHRAALADLTGQLDQLVPDFYERFTPPAPEREQAA